jgi:hypothetical protein
LTQLFIRRKEEGREGGKEGRREGRREEGKREEGKEGGKQQNRKQVLSLNLPFQRRLQLPSVSSVRRMLFNHSIKNCYNVCELF